MTEDQMTSAAAEPQDSPVRVINPEGAGRVVLICEHASYHIPSLYNGLGLDPQDRMSHAAWDPGAFDVSMRLSATLDAPLVAATVSRLVYDCNRAPDVASAMPAQSEKVTVPGNRDLSATDREARARAVYEPFCKAVDNVLDQRPPDTVVVTIHSFTHIFHGTPRAVEIGLLHDTDTRLADAMLADANVLLPHRRVERNAPYGPEDGVTHSLRLHALSHQMSNVMVELRNDLLLGNTQVQTMADEVLILLKPALAQLYPEGETT